MAVPDWPNTFGYNMFLFPVSRWVGGIFYEHTHRLMAAGIGLMTVILSIWLWRVEPRRWVQIFGACAVVGACLQGLLGGLRVVLIKDEIGVFHALLAQSFFVAISILAVVTSQALPKGAGRIMNRIRPCDDGRCWRQFLFSCNWGSAHYAQHIGLSIPDFLSPTGAGFQIRAP
jgi:cytochrome c oxidase assembly protein subunit 15